MSSSMELERGLKDIWEGHFVSMNTSFVFCILSKIFFFLFCILHKSKYNNCGKFDLLPQNMHFFSTIFLCLVFSND